MFNRLLFFLAMYSTTLFSQSLIPASHEFIQYKGRVDQSKVDFVEFDWPGTQILIEFEGSSIGFEMKNTNAFFEVSVDEELPINMQVTPAQERYMVASALSVGTHRLRISKRSETAWGSVKFYGFLLEEGKSLKPLLKKSDRRIEFIGDSHTVGYGNESPGQVEGEQDASGRDCSDEELHRYTNTNLAFSALVAEHFNAEAHINAISGKGMVRNYNEGPTSAMPFPNYYQSTLISSVGRPLWDFSSWIPQIVVLGLGINDHSTAGVDAATFKQRYHEFLAEIRGRYPGVPLILLSAGAGSAQTIALEGIVKDELEQGQEKLYHLTYEARAFGCHWHPDLLDHRKLADTLIQKIKELNLWPQEESTAVNKSSESIVGNTKKSTRPGQFLVSKTSTLTLEVDAKGNVIKQIKK